MVATRSFGILAACSVVFSDALFVREAGIPLTLNMPVCFPGQGCEAVVAVINHIGDPEDDHCDELEEAEATLIACQNKPTCWPGKQKYLTRVIEQLKEEKKKKGCPEDA